MEPMKAEASLFEDNIPQNKFEHAIERFSDGSLVRTIRIQNQYFVTSLPAFSDSGDAESDWWLQIIRGVQPTVIRSDTKRKSLRIADLFCGSGGFSNGIKMAADALGLRLDVRFAVDTDAAALQAYQRNHNPKIVIGQSVKDILDSQILISDDEPSFYYHPEIVDDRVRDFVGSVDLVVAGPPCQGHSNLNNHTRRDDVRNALYPTAAEIAVALGAKAILIENVPAVLHDKYKSVEITRKLLSNLSWSVDNAVLAATKIGWPQTRKRHFLAASLTGSVLELHKIENELKSATRPLSWLLGDILEPSKPTYMDDTSKLSEENIDRINYLFDNDVYLLPNHVRPLKHQNGHTYPSSYGRMKWDKPSGTITTGFMTPGRGKFVHPLKRRPITPREAARIQGFPDSFDFGDPSSPPSRTSLAKWIGDAIPSPLGYAAAFSVLGTLI
jgi:DNA (cytosine-5)-methyltransferase 1